MKLKEILLPTEGHSYIISQLVNTPEYKDLYKGPVFDDVPEVLPKIASYSKWADAIATAFRSTKALAGASPELMNLYRSASTPIDRICAYSILYYEVYNE